MAISTFETLPGRSIEFISIKPSIAKV